MRPAPRAAAAPVAALLAAAAAGCFEDLQHPADVVGGQLRPGTLHVGALLPLSEGSGLSQRDAVLLAGAEAGVTLVVADSRPERLVGAGGVDEALRRRLEQLRRAGVPALVVADDATALAARRAGDSSGPVVLAYATGGDPAVAAPRGAPTFRLSPAHADAGRAMAALALEAGPRVAVLHLRGDPFGEGLRAAVEAAVRAAGGEVVPGAALDPAVRGGQRERVAPVIRSGPDAIVPALPAGVAASVINEAPPASSPLRWVFPHTAVSPAFLDNVADLAPLAGAPAVAPSPGGGPAYAAFEAAFLARTGRAPGPFDALAYDAVRLVAAAADGDAAVTGRNLAVRLAQLDWPGAHASWRLRFDGTPASPTPLSVWRLDPESRSFVPEGPAAP